MKETDEIDIKIKIANQEVKLRQPVCNQEFIRDVESRVEELWRTWRARFPQLSESRLLAMMVYQYASFYMQQGARFASAEKAVRSASDFLAEALSGGDKA